MASVSHYHLAVLCDSTHSVLIFLQYKPHRYNKSYMPKGFSTIADKWIGLCSYCNKASHERALCSECAPLSDNSEADAVSTPSYIPLNCFRHPNKHPCLEDRSTSQSWVYMRTSRCQHYQSYIGSVRGRTDPEL